MNAQTTHSAVRETASAAPAARGRVLAGTVLAQLGLGTVYAWSIMNPPLAAKYGTDAFDISITFSIMMIALSVSTLSIGWLQAKFGVRNVLVACGIVLGVGLFLAGLAPNVYLLYVFAGVMVGAADGIGYLLSLTNVLKWYPDKAGAIAGISVGSYGIPAVILPFIVTPVLGTADQGFPGLQTCFTLWAVTVIIAISGGGLLLKDAPVIKKAGTGISGEYTIPQMLRKPQAYMLYFGITAFCFAGLYIIGNSGSAATSVAKTLGIEIDKSAYLIGTTVSIVALVGAVNTIGRFFFGWLSDHVKRTLIVALALTVLAVFAFILGTSFLGQVPPGWLYILGFLLFGLSFGGCITIYPTIVGEFFGKNNQAKNYSVIYQGFASGALITLVFNILIANHLLTFGVSLLIGAVFLAISAVLLFIVKKPGPAPTETGATA